MVDKLEEEVEGEDEEYVKRDEGEEEVVDNLINLFLN